MDFKLDPNSWDIIWQNGALNKEDTTQTLTETVGQRLKIRLLTFYSEWFINTAYGVPYFSMLLGRKQKSKAAIDLIFQQQILLEVGVKEIVNFSSTFVNRQYSLVAQVKVNDGTITAPIIVQPLQ